MSYARKISQFTAIVLPLACSRVIGQRGLVSQHRAWTNQGGSADMAAAPDDCVVQASLCANSRVTPNNRVLDVRALFDVASFAEHRVNYFDTGLKRAVISNDGQVVDLCMRG